MTLVALVTSLVVSACSAPPAVNVPQVACNPSGPARVQIFGGIRKPGALSFEPGLTVYAALQRAGGLSIAARRRELRVVRCGHAIGPIPVPEAAGAGSDMSLERGDIVDVTADYF